jgi:hypothetical protein
MAAMAPAMATRIASLASFDRLGGFHLSGALTFASAEGSGTSVKPESRS